MLTVLESLKLSTDFLEKKGIESSRLNAELLLSGILKCKRLDLYLKFDHPLKENEINQYREWITRRGKFEPLQYIIGYVEFYGLLFKVNPDVLIPRPETEILVEEVIKFCKDKSGLRILDIGTGSGNISISLAKNLSNAEITAIDISGNALKIAEENSVSNEVYDKIKFIQADINLFTTEQKFDIIVSNPPYVKANEYETLQKEISYEPKIAVTDQNNGLDFYNIIADRTKVLLKNLGILYLEVGKDQSQQVARILEMNDFTNIHFVKDYQQIDRVVVGELI